MMMERIPILFILISSALSGRHVSGFLLPSGACSFPPSIAVAVVDRHHNDRRRHSHSVVVVVVNSSISSMKLMASTSGINISSSSNSNNNDTAYESTSASSSTILPPQDETTTTTTIVSKAPSLNGKIVLPVKVMAAGLQGHRVAAVYAILNSNYKRGSGEEGWEHVMHIGITKDLARDIAYFTSLKGSEAVAHVRALSFSYPQKATMEDFANGWRQKVNEAATRQGEGQVKGSKCNNNDGDDHGADVFGWGKVPLLKDQDVNGSSQDPNKLVGNVITVRDYDEEEDDDDDDDDMDEDDLDDYLQMMAESRAAISSSPPPLFVDNTGLTNIVSLKNKNDEIQDVVISPFETSNSIIATTKQTTSPLTDGELSFFELGIENVDKVLDEVRPYLISDGGNVRVQSVDTETGNVYLLLEGACGSCASSTVTMKMGIERVLKEKFGDTLGEVIQVEGEEGGGSKPPSELTIEAVQTEVNRMSAAITAMGGVVRVVTVDPIGVVEIEFRGPNRVKKGLELALLDVEFVKHVKFVS